MATYHLSVKAGKNVSSSGSIGLDSRIDHRSYQKIGTEIQSQNFRADYISHDKYLISENINEIRRQNGETIIEKPSEVLKVLTSTQSFFTIREPALKCGVLRPT